MTTRGHHGLLMSGGGGGGGGFPTLLSLNSQVFHATVPSHNVLMPTTVAAGTLLVIAFSNDNNAGVTVPAGWTNKSTAFSSPSSVRVTVLTKVAVGTEGGTSVNVVTSSGAEGHAFVLHLTGASGNVNASQKTFSSQANIPVLALTPAWGSKNTFWFVFSESYYSTTVSQWPLSDNQTTTDWRAGSCQSRISTKQIAVGTLSPVNLVLSSNSFGAICTIGIEPL